jgi:hypothetical protein
MTGGEREMAHYGLQKLINPDVRFGPQADILINSIADRQHSL